MEMGKGNGMAVNTETDVTHVIFNVFQYSLPGRTAYQ